MTRNKTVVLLFALVVVAAFAVPSVTAQQETPTETDAQTGEDTATPTEEETPEDNATETETPEDEETPGDNATETETPEDDGEPGDAEEEASVTFDDQETNGTTVTVDSATLTEPGYVVIHDEVLEEGNLLDSTIGVSEYLPAGEYDNVTITLYEVPGANFSEQMNETGNNETVQVADNETMETPTGDNETMTETPADDTETPADDTETPANETSEQLRLTEDQTLTAMIHVESGDNEQFDYVSNLSLEDAPFLDEDDQTVNDTADVTVVDETTGNETGENETATPTETETETPVGTGTETPTGTAATTPPA